MKCDELKRFDIVGKYRDEETMAEFRPDGECYDADEVDAAIAELKAEITRKEGVEKRWFAQCMEARAENVMLKRALWMARDERAKARKNYWYFRSIHEGDKDLWSIDGSAVKYIGCIKRSNFDWLKIWSEVECKCLDKEGEYK